MNCMLLMTNFKFERLFQRSYVFFTSIGRKKNAASKARAF